MDIFGRKAAAKLGAELKRNVELENRIDRVADQLQSYIDAQTLEDNSSTYGYNNYRDYAEAVRAVSERYENRASWGSGLTANIIDFRAAVTVSSGPQYRAAERATMGTSDEEGRKVGGAEGAQGGDAAAAAVREIEFCRSFFEANDINHEAPQAWGREAEVEGRFAVELEWDEKKKQVIVVPRPWTKYHYEEERDPKNPKEIVKISWAASGADVKQGSAGGDNLVCRRFGGRESSKYPMTKVIRALTWINSLDQAFRDWREINRLFAAPIPIFECESEEEAERMDAAIKSGLNFKIKKAWALHGKFRFAAPEMQGVTSLENEVKRLACFIAGTTGYPLQFLLPDMLANRSTSENIMESALVHTASERAIWTGFYEELVKKAMILWAKGTGKTPLDPTKISITISLMTKEQWDRLVQFWLPAFRDELVTREAVLGMIPDFNTREELDRWDEKENSEVARIARELDKAQAEADAAGKQLPPAPGAPFNKTPKGEQEDKE